jgi:hypothetical protein
MNSVASRRLVILMSESSSPVILRSEARTPAIPRPLVILRSEATKDLPWLSETESRSSLRSG